MSNISTKRRRRSNNLPRRLLTVLVMTLIGAFVQLPLAALALEINDEDAMSAVIAKYSQYDMPRNSIISYLGRQVGWALIRFLSWLSGLIEDAVWQISDLFQGFTASEDAQSLVNKAALVGAALFVFVVLYLAWQAIIDKVKWADLFRNAVMSLIVLLVLPIGMTKALGLTRQVMTYIKGGSDTSITSSLVSENVIDITGYDTPEGFGSNGDVHPSGDLFGGAGISIVELVDPDDMSSANANIYNLYVDGDVLKEVDKAEYFGVKIDILSTQYYRYKVNWFPIFMSLIISCVAFLFSGVKIARLLYELAINQAVATVCAWLDMHSGQRLKKCLQMILATFFTLCGVYLFFAFYIIGQAWIASWDIIPQLIAMLAMAWALIDGPNLFEKIVGVDAGLQDGLRTMYGIRAATNMARAVGRGVVGTRMMDGSRVGGLINHSKSAAGKVGRAASGAAEAGGRVAGNVVGRIQGQKPVHATKGASGSSVSSASSVSSSTSKGSPSRPRLFVDMDGTLTQTHAKTDTGGNPQPPDISSAPAIRHTEANTVTAPDNAAAGMDSVPSSREPSDGDVETKAAALLESAKEAVTEEGTTREHTRSKESPAPVSMSEYIRNRAKNTGVAQTAQRLGSSAAKGYRDGKTLRQSKVQRKADNARTPEGEQKIIRQHEASFARYEKLQTLRERRESMRNTKADQREARAANKWLDKHDPAKKTGDDKK